MKNVRWAFVVLSWFFLLVGCSDDVVAAALDGGVTTEAGVTPPDASVRDGGATSEGGVVIDAGVDASVDLAITGAPGAMTVLDQRGLRANQAVSWSVSPNGGTITASGLYTAPAAPTTAAITATSQDGSGQTKVISIAIVPAPNASMSAPTVATASATGLVASVPVQLGVTYAWSITGGVIATGQGTDRISFTAGEVGALVVSCVVVNEAGSIATSKASVTVYATPVVSITAPRSTTAGTIGLVASVPKQVGATYAWTIAGGTITSGGGSESITFTAGSVGMLTLTCTATVGATVIEGTAKVDVYADPNAVIITAPPSITASDAFKASTVEQAGMTYEWTVSGASIEGGQGTRAIDLKSDRSGVITLNCRVTNGAGLTRSGDATVAILPRPAPVISAPRLVTVKVTSAASVASDPAFTYRWTIGGGAIVGSATEATVVFDVDANVGDLTLTCEVANALGVAESATVTIVKVLAPVASISAPTSINRTGGAASVAAQAGATYTWSITNGVIVSGSGTPAITFSANGTTATSLTLRVTVTNAAGSFIMGSATVDVKVGALRIESNNFPPNATAKVTGPNGFSQSFGLTGTNSLSDLEPGTYHVDVPVTISSLRTFTPALTPRTGDLVVTNGATATATVLFGDENRPPVITGAPTIVTVTVGDPVVIQYHLTDPEGGTVTSLSALAGTTPDSLWQTASTQSNDPSGDVTVTLDFNTPGARTLLVSASDQGNATSQTKVYIVVNPSAGPSPIVTKTQSLEATVALCGSGAVITFHPELYGSPLLIPEITIANDTVTIAGPDAGLLTLSPASTSRLFSLANGSLTVIGLTLKGGSATNGGAIDALASSAPTTLTVRDCVLTENKADAGSAISYRPVQAIVGDSFTIRRTTFTNNVTRSTAAGVVDNGVSAAGFGFTMSESTILHSGMGVRVPAGNADVTNCTFVTTNGTALSSRNLHVTQSTFSGDATSFALQTLGGAVDKSIFEGFLSNHIVDGFVSSAGYNLLRAADTSFSTLATDIVGVSAQLLPLGNYGGPTPTFFLVPGSPAFDAIPSWNCFGIDQRGYRRRGLCDIGAFEWQPSDD